MKKDIKTLMDQLVELLQDPTLTPEQRSTLKTLTLARNYGIGAQKMSKVLKLQKEDGDEY